METPPRKPLVTRMHLLGFGVLLAITATAWFKIPPHLDLPVHWGLDGEPDRVWPRDFALLVAPVVTLLILALTGLIGRFAPKEQVDPGRHVVDWALTCAIGVLAAIQFGLLLLGLGSDIDMIRIVSGAVAVLLFVVGNELRRAEPHPFATLRLPWPVRDPRNWKLSHAVTGILMMLGAALLALATWLQPDPSTLILTLAATTLIPALTGALCTLLLSSRTGAR